MLSYATHNASIQTSKSVLSDSGQEFPSQKCQTKCQTRKLHKFKFWLWHLKYIIYMVWNIASSLKKHKNSPVPLTWWCRKSLCFIKTELIDVSEREVRFPTLFLVLRQWLKSPKGDNKSVVMHVLYRTNPAQLVHVCDLSLLSCKLIIPDYMDANWTRAFFLHYD